jgi:hypothetical protein
MIILALIGAGLIGWWCKKNVTITSTTDKGLTPEGWKVDLVFTGVHVLFNVTEIVAVYRWCINLFKKEDKV